MAIQVKTDVGLGRAIEAMMNEIVDAKMCWTLLNDLSLSAQKNPGEFSQSPTFWSLVMHGLQDATLYRLCKIFDQHRKGGLHLKSLLETIRANRHMFSKDAFRNRLKANPAVISLVQGHTELDDKHLVNDIEFASENSNPTVKVLAELRDKHFAHKDSRAVVSAVDLFKTYPITHDEVTALLKRAAQIVNGYSLDFSAQAWSTKIVGHDDYQNVVSAVGEQLERYKEMMRREEMLHGYLGED